MTSPEIQPTEKVRHQIIRETYPDIYLGMQMIYNLAPIYYDRQNKKYS